MGGLPDISQLKYLRKVLNITQKDLAKELGLTQSTISRIENGTMDPPYSKAKIIFDFLEGKGIDKNKSKKHAADIMTKDIISISPQATVKNAVDLMTKHKISQIPILDKLQNLGSVTAKKIQKYIIDDPAILQLKVSEISELPFPEVEANWDIQDISNLLLVFPGVLVKDKKHFVGIITYSNCLKNTAKE